MQHFSRPPHEERQITATTQVAACNAGLTRFRLVCIALGFHTVEFASDHVLIEEVQSDRVRAVAYVKRWIGRCRRDKSELPAWFELGGTLDEIERYIDRVLAPYLSLWQEAMQ